MNLQAHRLLTREEKILIHYGNITTIILILAIGILVAALILVFGWQNFIIGAAALIGIMVLGTLSVLVMVLIRIGRWLMEGLDITI